jgi:hypothetical protein
MVLFMVRRWLEVRVYLLHCRVSKLAWHRDREGRPWPLWLRPASGVLQAMSDLLWIAPDEQMTSGMRWPRPEETS